VQFSLWLGIPHYRSSYLPEGVARVGPMFAMFKERKIVLQATNL
jgi:hypothetical protein